MIRNVLLAIIAGWPLLGWAAEQERVDQPSRIAGVGSDLAIIKKDASTGFANAGWKYDRYSDLPSLDAGRRMIVADLKGHRQMGRVRQTSRYLRGSQIQRGLHDQLRLLRRE
mgnify:CR=1 FL=1